MKFLKNWMFDYVSIGHKLIGALSYYQFVFGSKNQLVHRHDYQEIPPRVDYSLTELGKKLLTIIDALADFGNYYKSLTKEEKS